MRTGQRFARVGAVAGVCLSIAMAACADDDAKSSASSPAAAPEVQEACDRLAQVGHAILAVRGAETREDVRAGVDEPYQAFVGAADATGDVQLMELAHRAQDRLEAYLTSPDVLDAREAGDDADVALDRSIRRCIELGATTEFPKEPGPAG